MTLTSWWKPGGGSRVEDLLTPGTDAEKDLGLALFALHRAGAEACELVAKTAVADEAVLIAALAETRMQLAPMAVEVISKGVGGAAYAGLLLKDLLDDAEIAALALYRTSVAKNVAPPIAAQRVGAVYGVSSRAMAKYAALASDPKANVTAVADLADRTLFDYVAKTVAAEYTPEPELVSKIGEQTPYEDAKNVKHGPGGRYVAESDEARPASLEELFSAAQTKTEQEATTAPEVARPTPQRSLRSMKGQRSLKSLRSMPAQQAEPSAMQVSPFKLRFQQAAFKLGLSPKAMELQELTHLAPMPLTGNERPMTDLRRKRGQAKHDTPLDRNVSFILEDSEYMALLRASGTIGAMNVFRAGGLVEYAGQPRVYGVFKDTTTDHESGVEHAMQVIGERMAKEPHSPVETVKIRKPADDDDIAQAKLAWLRVKQKDPRFATINPATELSNVQHAPSHQNPEEMVLIWRPPHIDAQGRRHAAPKIERLIEIVLAQGAVKGKRVSNKVELDDNQALVTENLLSPDASFVQTWDEKLKVMRVMVTAIGTDEQYLDAASWQPPDPSDFFKAATYLDIHNVTNSPETGRFVREGTLEELFAASQQREVKVAQPRRQRRLASLRAQRALPRAKEQLVTAPLETKAMQASLKQRPFSPALLKMVELRRAHVPRGSNALLYTDPNSTYASLSPASMDLLLEKGQAKGFLGEGMTLQVEGPGRTFLSERIRKPGSPHEADLMIEAQEAWVEQKKRLADQMGVETNDPSLEAPLLNELLTDFRGELPGLVEQIGAAMQANDDIQLLNVEITSSTKGRTRVKITRNLERIPDVHSIELAEGLRVDDVRRLREGGVARLHNTTTLHGSLIWLHEQAMSHGRHVVEVIADPHVRTWHAE